MKKPSSVCANLNSSIPTRIFAIASIVIRDMPPFSFTLPAHWRPAKSSRVDIDSPSRLKSFVCSRFLNPGSPIMAGGPFSAEESANAVPSIYRMFTHRKLRKKCKVKFASVFTPRF